MQAVVSIPRPIQWQRVLRAISIAVTVALLGFALLELQAIYAGAASRGEVAYDANNMFAAGRHWVETGEVYYPFQLEGPYLNVGTIMLYPPFALYLFVPFAYLPAILWWIVPLTLIGWSFTWLKPAWWTWPYLAWIAGSVNVLAALVYGNSLMWVLAAICLATRWPAVAAVLPPFKPSDALFAIPAMRSRKFWIGLAICALLSLPLLPAWFDWLTAMKNFAAAGATAFYSIASWIVLATPWVIVASRDLPQRIRRPAASRAKESAVATRKPAYPG